MIFAWDDRNREHIAKHGVSEAEAEEVVEAAKPPYPRAMGDGKFLVWHQTQSGRHLQVIIVFKLPEEVAYESLPLEQWSRVAEMPRARIVRVIHAMEMTEKMKHNFQRESR